MSTHWSFLFSAETQIAELKAKGTLMKDCMSPGCTTKAICLIAYRPYTDEVVIALECDSCASRHTYRGSLPIWTTPLPSIDPSEMVIWFSRIRREFESGVCSVASFIPGKDRVVNDAMKRFDEIAESFRSL
jgi:hypothetical protein